MTKRTRPAQEARDLPLSETEAKIIEILFPTEAARAWAALQQITDDPADDGRDAEEAAEDTDAIIALLRQIDERGE